MKKERLIFPVLLAIILVLGYFILQPNVRQNLRFFWTDYAYIVYAFLILGVVFVILNRFYPEIGVFLKYPYFIVFLPIALFPVLRCYFKVPYTFCHICPKRCPWGELAPATLPLFLLQNIDNRFWCFKLCPWGTLQDIQSKLVKKRLHPPAYFQNFRYLVLLFVTAILFVTFYLNPRLGFFYIGGYNFVIVTFIAALAIFSLAFFIPRFWCNYFCPIGTLGKLVLKLKNKLLR